MATDIVSDFLYWKPPLGGMPDSTIRIGVGFEVGGVYEDWGFVVERGGKTVGAGRTLAIAIERARAKICDDYKASDEEKCACGNQPAMHRRMPDGTMIPVCMKCAGLS